MNNKESEHPNLKEAIAKEEKGEYREYWLQRIFISLSTFSFFNESVAQNLLFKVKVVFVLRA